MSELVAAFRGSPSLTQRNRARLSLQRYGTPNEVAHIEPLMEHLPDEAAAWLRRLRDYCFWEHPTPSPYVREEQGETWSVFRGPGPRDDRELVVGFSGHNGNLMQPTPVVLQYLDPARHDLLLLNDPERTGFLGLDSEDGSFPHLVERIAVEASGYRSLVTIGVSIAGLPAVIAGLLLKARRAVSIGGRIGDRRPVERYTELDLRAFQARAGGATEVLCLYGAENRGDREGALSFKGVLPDALLVGVAGVRSHSVPHACFQAGTLRSLYALMVGPSAPTRLPEGSAASDSELPNIVDLVADCEPPEWASSGSAPTAWTSNTIGASDRFRGLVKNVRLPARLASALERLLRRRLGISAGFRRW